MDIYIIYPRDTVKGEEWGFDFEGIIKTHFRSVGSSLVRLWMVQERYTRV